MDRRVKCLTLLAFLLCCCIHSTAQKTQEESGWTAWTNWSACSKTCGQGLHQRVREWRFLPSEPNRQKFMNTDRMSCALDACPVNGSWSPWGMWGECSAPCGEGARQRLRYCNNPPPADGGANCTGKTTDKSACMEEPCPPTPPLFDMTQCVKETNFTCLNNRMCVPLRQQCDGKVQCSDGSDEKGCRRRSRYKIGRVHFSNSSPRQSASSVLAVFSLLMSTWFVKLFIGGQRHTADQSAPRP